MRVIQTLFIISFIASRLIGSDASPSSELRSLITSLENGVQTLANAATGMLSATNLCSQQTRTCSVCNYDGCQSSGITDDATTQATCSQDFGTPPECSSSGQMVSFERSTIKVADDVDVSLTGTNKLRNAFKDICASNTLDASFKEIGSSSANIAWQYIGTPNGVYRIFPGHTWSANNGRCSLYDPRTRPWYVAATTGAKSVILVLDRSGSMLGGTYRTRWDVTVEASNRVLDTLSNADYFGIVVFSDYASTYRSNLMRATASNVRNAKSFLYNVNPVGNTYYDTGFDEAFDMFDRATSLETGTGACRKVILFMTDGNPTGGSGPRAVNTVNSRNSDHHAFIVSFVLNPSGNVLSDIPKEIACDHRGVYSEISDTYDLIGAMSNYYQFLAVGLQRREVVWSEPYEDALGIGTVTTASIPIYDNSTEPPTLVAVAGIDVKMDIFKSFGGVQSDSVLSALLSQSQRCTEFALSECAFEHLRAPNYCNVTLANSCTNPDSTTGTCPMLNGISDPWCQNTDQYSSSSEFEQLACCNDDSINAAVVGGAVAGAVVVLAAIGFAVYRTVSKRKAQNFQAKANTAANDQSQSHNLSGSNPMNYPPSNKVPDQSYASPTYPPADTMPQHSYPTTNYPAYSQATAQQTDPAAPPPVYI